MTIDVFKLPEAELNIMRILWDKEAIMTTDQLVTEYRVRYNRAVKPSTINTLAGRLMNKGMLTYVQSGGRNLYMPVCRKEKYQALVAAEFLKVLFNGSVAEMVFAMLKEGGIEAKEWESLIELVDMVEVPKEVLCAAERKAAVWKPVFVAAMPSAGIAAFTRRRLRTKCIPRAS